MSSWVPDFGLAAPKCTIPPADIGLQRSYGAEVRERIRTSLENDELELPVLPDMIAKLIAAVNDERQSAQSLAELVRRDPSITGHTLRLANSPLYRGSSPIVSLQQAISRLGMGRLREILMVVACQTTSSYARSRVQTVKDDFATAVAAAMFAQEIARMRRGNLEEAFLGGLLHDIGRPMVLHAAVEIAESLGFYLTGADEEAILDELHAAAGERVVLSWHLPPSLALVVRHHHDPPAAGAARRSAAIVALGDACARIALARPGAKSAQEIETDPLLAMLGLSADDVNAILARGEELLEQGAAFS